ncbi:hypothetical protein HHL17_22725 [Chitinophaga sp. G-6-1-13]|uniref:Uncharacterized protein n=1 Tax=Chitinophaga fulva TaxID=2728842 RepID=A0A848GNP7_9BACT|nr:hypothetical protein [Chitinophaga fulva]NML40034.1 hypothetical protein [Chitinophaga fulva]
MNCTFFRGLLPGLLCSIVLLAACHEGNKKTSNKQTTAKAANADSLHNKSNGEFLPTKTYVEGIVSRRKAIAQQLPGISPEAAVKLYNSLVLYVDTALAGISANESVWLDKYVNYYSEEKKKIVPPDSVQRAVDLLATAGIEPWGIGEGYTELRTVPVFYTQLFKTSLPADYRSYLQLNADEDTVLYSADAGLSVSFNQVGLRTLNWEQFLEAYPNSILSGNAKENFERYCEDYLFGEDNTPSFENWQEIGSLNQENKEEYLSFVQKHGNTRTAAIVKLFLEKVGTEKSMDNLKQDIRKEIKQAFAEHVALLPAQADFGPAQVEQLTKSVYDTVPDEVADNKVSRALDSMQYFRHDGNTYCLAAFRNEIKDGGAPAAGWVDIWIFKNSNGSWQHTAHLLNAGGGGMYGSSGYFSDLVKLGSHSTGIVISGGITHMGSNVFWDDVLAFSNDKLSSAFSLVRDNAYDNGAGTQHCSYNRWQMQPVAQEENYRLVIIAGSCLNGNLPLEKTIVPFKNGAYNIPDKFKDRGI